MNVKPTVRIVKQDVKFIVKIAKVPVRIANGVKEIRVADVVLVSTDVRKDA